MIEESNIYLNQTCLEMNTLKKSKACKIPTLHLAEGKRITKTKLSMIPNNVTLKLKVPQILKETLLKRNNIEKVRKHLKLDIARHQRVEECIYEEKLYTAGEEESKPEDQMMQQPVPNQIYQIEEEVTEKKENPISFPNSLQINEKYSEKMLARFNENEIIFSPQNFLQNHKITPFMRSKMIDWFIEVLTSYKCLDETFFLAISLMDRFFSKSTNPQDVQELHLIGVTSVFIACKYEEIYPLRLQTVYERIAHKKLSCEQIKSKELEILESIDFNVTGPTIYDYVILLLNLISMKTQIAEEKFAIFEKIVSYISKLVIFEYDIISNKSISSVAAGVLYVSFKILEQIEINFNLTDNMQKIKMLLGLEDSALIEVATQILWLAKNFDKIFQNLSNLKRFNTELFDELQKMQNKNKEESGECKKSLECQK